MKRFSVSMILLIGILFGISCSGFQPNAPESSSENAQSPRLSPQSELLPVDQAVTKGTLDNGLTYLIRHNAKPENRIELRLVVRAGSVLEDDDQRGLAHFVEHMAFNGTENFQKHELINYLESIGMRFGPDLNAYTSFDETVFMLQVPSDDTEILETAFLMLSDWAHAISFDGEEIDKERGVVIEEWRSGRGAAARIRDKQYPILLKDSKYAERMPIGKEDILESFDHETLRRFYSDWYRPDLMAVIVVGDIAQQQVTPLIQRFFGEIQPHEDTRKREFFPVPDHDDVLYAIATDPEATQSTISVYFKHEARVDSTVSDYRDSIIERLFTSMFSQRLDELTREADPPYLYAYSGMTGLLTRDFFVLGSAVKEDGIARGFETLLTEAERIRRHGFTQTELARAGNDLLRSMETALAERDKTDSGDYASEYVRHITRGETIPGIEYEYSLYQRYIPEITLDEVNRLADKLITDKNRVVMASMPEKDGVTIPDEYMLETILQRVDRKDIQPYIDTVSDKPLADSPVHPVQVSGETVVEEAGVTIMTLGNGVRVVLKPTDFKNDEILFEAASPGGHSLAPDEWYIPAVSAPGIIDESGIGDFTLTELEKMLSGKVVSVSPWISELQEGLSGSTSPRDLETLFQLVYLYFTAPRKDFTAFSSYQSRLRGYIENRGAQPETAFNDTAKVTLSNYHYRSRPWTLDLLDEMDLNASYELYRDRFSDAGDFTFYFVGAFDIETIRPMITTWLGNLPSTGQIESWHDIGEHYPQGIIKKEVYRGIEEKSQVRLYFTGPFNWSRQNRYIVDSLIRILRIRFREVVREELSGTYGVRINSDLSHYPDEKYMITVGFGCEPGRTGDLTATILEEIKTLQQNGTTKDYLEKVKEIQRREFELEIKKNDYWLDALSSYEFNGDDIRKITDYTNLVDSLTLEDIQNASNRYFDFENYVQIVLFPENAR